ncbi:MAG: hypothetical protein AAB556_02710 [Patescibacteria group bacterium]
MGDNRDSIFISKHAIEKIMRRFGFKEKGDALRERVIKEIKNGRRLSIQEVMKRKLQIDTPKHFILFEKRIYILNEINCVITAFLDKN